MLLSRLRRQGLFTGVTKDRSDPTAVSMGQRASRYIVYTVYSPVACFAPSIYGGVLRAAPRRASHNNIKILRPTTCANASHHLSL